MPTTSTLSSNSRAVTITLSGDENGYQPELNGEGGNPKDSDGNIGLKGTQPDITQSDSAELTVTCTDPKIESATLTIGNAEYPIKPDGFQKTFSLEPGQEEIVTAFTLEVTLADGVPCKRSGDNDWGRPDGQTWTLDPYVTLKRKKEIRH